MENTAPVKCPAGRYGNKNGIKNESCTGECPLNHYCPKGSHTPILCPDGMSTLSVGGEKEDDCVTCAAGTILISAAGDPLKCQICGMGKYNDDPAAIGAKCKECNVGRYNIDRATDKKLHDNLVDCKACARGLYFVSSFDLCRVCPQGYYQDQMVVDWANCTQCPVATHIVEKERESIRI